MYQRQQKDHKRPRGKFLGSGGGGARKAVEQVARQAAETLRSAIFGGASHYERATELLGGAIWTKRHPASAVEVHDAVVEGVPYASLNHLLAEFKTVPEEDVAQAIGVSTRTLQRQRSKSREPMAPELGSRAWQLAETLAKAEDVLGNHADAERWLIEPAMGLDGKRPIELLQTAQGAQLVGDFLGRLQFGVYN